jgi:hypothetical protein
VNIRTLTLAASIVFLTVAAGCSSGTRCVRVPVPPRVDLRAYPTVGLVTFTAGGNANGGGKELDQLSTQKFLAAVQAAQPGVRVIELGPETQVLASVKRQAWDVATLRAVKEAHGVDVIVLGRVDVDRAKPQVSFSAISMLKQVNVRADVDARLNAKLIETGSGATMWTDGAACTTNVANASVNDHGQGGFGVADPKGAYGQMLDGLVWNLTDAFRTHYVTRRVPRDQVSVAAAE